MYWLTVVLLIPSLVSKSVVVQEHRPPGQLEQEIFDDGSGSPLWELCDVAVHFALEVRTPHGRGRRESPGGEKGEGPVCGRERG